MNYCEHSWHCKENIDAVAKNHGIDLDELRQAAKENSPE